METLKYLKMYFCSIPSLPIRILESQSKRASMLMVAFNSEMRCSSSTYSASHLPLISSLVV